MIARIRSLAFEARNSPFARNIGRLATFTIAGQLITLASAPVLSRLYGPSEFGLFGLFLAFAMFASVVTTLFYEGAIPVARSEDEAFAVAAGTVLVSLAGATLLTFAYAALIVGDVFGYGVLPVSSAGLMWLFLVSQAAVTVPQYWFVRRQKFKPVGQGILALNGGRAAGQIAAGAAGTGWGGLGLGEIAGRVVNAAGLWRAMSREMRQSAVARPSWQCIRIALHHHRNFALILLPAMTLDTLVSTVLLSGVNFIYGTAAAGQFFLMRRVIDLPMGFIAKTLSDAFHGKAAEIAVEAPERLRPLVARMFWGLAAASTIGLLPVMLFGPSLFAFVFGEEWRQAGLLTAMFIPGAILNLAALPISRVFALTRRQKLRYIFTAINATGVVAILIAAHLLDLSLVWMVGLISALTVTAYGLYAASAYIAAGHVRDAQSPQARA